MGSVLTQNYLLLALGLPGAAEDAALGGADHVPAGDGALVLQHGGAVVQLYRPDKMTVTDPDIDRRNTADLPVLSVDVLQPPLQCWLLQVPQVPPLHMAVLTGRHHLNSQQLGRHIIIQ